MMHRIVVDSNVMVAGLMSRRGTSFRLLQLVGRRRFTTAVSVPLVVEYQKAVLSTLSLRLPDSLHERTRTLARREHVPVNQLISTAVAEKISALMTEDYLEERAKRGKRKDYDAVLAKVPDVEPHERDRF